MTQTIAIIGAGMAGLTLASQLAQYSQLSGVQITVFDKSRGVGGRMSTRYADPYEFDHGAQYFTARSAPFKAQLESWQAAAIVQAWPDENRYVARPRMNAVPKALAAGLAGRASLELNTQITALERKGGDWHLTDKDGVKHGPFDWVVTATPSPQALALLPQNFAKADVLSAAQMLPAFTLMVGTDQADLPRFEHRRFDGEPIAQVSVNSAKPGRHSLPSIVIQADNDWAAAHIDMNKDTVTAQLLACYERLCDVDLAGAVHIALHRWLYANVGQSAEEDYLIDPAQNLAACGDWCIAGRVEAAFTSGYELAGALKTALA